MAERIASPRTAGEMLKLARDFLARKGLDEARLDAELLVAHALGLDRLGLFMQLDRPLTPAEVDTARALLVRRGRREPTAYIIGAREFYGRPFQVGPAVLIPRPETELLVDRAREIAREHAGSELAILDVGTGSGCIAITLALEIPRARNGALEQPGARVDALDISLEALELARANADALGARVEFHQGDAFELLARLRAARARGFDLLVSNPPYVTHAERAQLAPEVREHEPALALYAPVDDAHHWVRRLLSEGKRALAPGGTLLVELGAGQAAAAREIAREQGLDVRLHRDLAGIERVLEAR